MKIDLHPSNAEDTFEHRWIDLVKNTHRNKGQVKGGTEREFYLPEDYSGQMQCKDWILLVKKI